MENGLGRWKGSDRIQAAVKRILDCGEKMIALSDGGLRLKTGTFQIRLDGGGALGGLLPEAFAAVRETARRVLGMEPFPVRLAGGVVLGGMKSPERRTAYACDITYVTNHELGFDCLREHMAPRLDQVVQRGLAYAIILKTVDARWIGPDSLEQPREGVGLVGYARKKPLDAYRQAAAQLFERMNAEIRQAVASRILELAKRGAEV